jgi:hypothetical protein
VTLRRWRDAGSPSADSRRRTSRCSGPRARDARASAAERARSTANRALNRYAGRALLGGSASSPAGKRRPHV